MRRDSSQLELDRRSREVLEAVVKAYVDTGEPVGSRTVSKLSSEQVSAATVRNVMADLEERGLLSHPHTSAGRVPTDLGYRVYVDSLGTRTLRRSEERLIESSLHEEPAEINELFTAVSRVLARFSRHLGVVVSPHITRVRLRDIEFVRLGPKRVLVIVIAGSGILHNKVIHTADDFDQEWLDKIGRYLTTTFKALTLPEIRDRILELMGQEKALYDRLLADALKLGHVGLDPAGGEAGEVFLEGTTNLLAEPEFGRIERLRGLFRTFEEKHELLRILNSCLEQRPGGVQVFIGSENASPEMIDCSLVTSSYGLEGQRLGALGIIGPTRMEYARAIALVESVARLFSQALSRYPG